MTRNPRDACVSLYNHFWILEGYQGTFEDFTEVFLNDICAYYTPFIHHVKQFWDNRHLDYVCFNAYEEMKADLPSVMKEVANFLERPIQDEEKFQQCLEHLSFDKMKQNAAVNKEEYVEVNIIFHYEISLSLVIF